MKNPKWSGGLTVGPNFLRTEVRHPLTDTSSGDQFGLPQICFPPQLIGLLYKLMLLDHLHEYIADTFHPLRILCASPLEEMRNAKGPCEVKPSREVKPSPSMCWLFEPIKQVTHCHSEELFPSSSAETLQCLRVKRHPSGRRAWRSFLDQH